jgi:hypothetical protein
MNSSVFCEYWPNGFDALSTPSLPVLLEVRSADESTDAAADSDCCGQMLELGAANPTAAEDGRRRDAAFFRSAMFG